MNCGRDNHLFVTTGEQRMLNMIETLRKMPKPNGASHGGRTVFLFCLEEDYGLPVPVSIMGLIWSGGRRLPS